MRYFIQQCCGHVRSVSGVKLQPNVVRSPEFFSLLHHANFIDAHRCITFFTNESLDWFSALYVGVIRYFRIDPRSYLSEQKVKKFLNQNPLLKSLHVSSVSLSPEIKLFRLQTLHYAFVGSDAEGLREFLLQNSQSLRELHLQQYLNQYDPEIFCVYDFMLEIIPMLHQLRFLSICSKSRSAFHIIDFSYFFAEMRKYPYLKVHVSEDFPTSKRQKTGAISF
jgi:hypothetical protein